MTPPPPARPKRKPRKVGMLERAWRRTWTFRLTPAGKTTLAGIMMAGMTCWVTLTIPIYHVFCALVSAYLVNSLMSLWNRPRLEARLDLPRRAVAGQTVGVRVRLRNRSTRRAACDVGAGLFELPPGVEMAEAPPMLPVLGPGESAELTVPVKPVQRGLHALGGAQVYTTFPFNLSRNWPRRLPAGRLLALPSFHPIRRVELPVGTRYQPGGIALTSHVGESPEYIGSREYRPGDLVRRLDFRSWARLGRPVVREYQEEYYCRVGLVVDTYVSRRRSRRAAEDFEAAVSLSAAAADALCGGEYIIDLFAAGPELYVFRAGRHTAHFENILEILACVEACRSDPFDVVSPALADELQNISAVVFVLLDWDDSRRTLVQAAAEAGCAVRVLVVRSARTGQDLAGASVWAESVRQLDADEVHSGAVEVL